MARSIERADIDLVLGMIREWVNLLAARDFEQAACYLAPIPGAKVQYSAGSIEQALGYYSRRYRNAPEHEKRKLIPAVTALNEMDPDGETMTIYKMGPEAAVIDYDLPIEGKWSDLTAKFRLVQLPEGFGLGLIDLHVL